MKEHIIDEQPENSEIEEASKEADKENDVDINNEGKKE